MFDCLTFEKLICDELDGEISTEEQSALDAHLASCPNCRRYRAAMQLFHELLQEEESAPDGFVADVMTALPDRRRNIFDLHPAADLTAAFGETAAAGLPGARRRFPVRHLAGLAAALIVVAGLGLFAARGGRSSAAAPQAASYKTAAAESAAEEAKSEEVYSTYQTFDDAPAEAETPMAAAAAEAEMATAAAEDEPPMAAAAGTTAENGAWEARYAEADEGVYADTAQDATAPMLFSMAAPAPDPIADAARDYVTQEMPEELDAILDLDRPLVEEQTAPLDYLPVRGDYQPQGTCYAVTFETVSDAILGPIVVLVDEGGTVYGLLPRE